MKKNYLLILFTLFSLHSFAQTWSLIWKDEFDSTALDTKKWSPAIGNGCDINLCGWGNQEKEYYRNENVTVANGLIRITAKKETFQTENYTSGRITTSGKASWKYGKMVARIKMSKGQGLWHAFWMLPQDLAYGTWPQSGEIDIMEYFGHKPNMIQSTIHYGSPWPNNSYNYKQVFSTDYSTDFHLYTLLWEANHIAFYVDSTLINDLTPASIAPKNWPFDQRFYFILNTAVGGNLTNNTIDDAILPGFMDVDYVRVFAKNTTSGLNNIDIQNAMLYPNPVSSSFKIALTNNENASILISSAVGTTLLKIDKYTSDTSIDLSFASAGIYFVTIKTNEGTAIQKIIKTQ